MDAKAAGCRKEVACAATKRCRRKRLRQDAAVGESLTFVPRLRISDSLARCGCFPRMSGNSHLRMMKRESKRRADVVVSDDGIRDARDAAHRGEAPGAGALGGARGVTRFAGELSREDPGPTRACGSA